MIKIYSTRLAIRIAIFVAAIRLYLTDKNSLMISNEGLLLNNGVKPIHLFWLVLAVEMIQKFFPQNITSMGCRKLFKSNYIPCANQPTESNVIAWRRKENKIAIQVLALWVGGNGVMAGLHYLKILGESEMVLLSLGYFVGDLVCLLVYCPFQTLIMKNRCCLTCRIFNWDAMMICTPLIFVPSYFSRSLIFIAFILLVWWEYAYYKHPLRFFEAGNQNLQCKYCKEQICKIKKRALGDWRSIFKKQEKDYKEGGRRLKY